MANKKGNTVELVTRLVEPVAQELGLQIWDVRFEKEGAGWYLRVFIEKEGLTIDDCETFSRRVDPLLDEVDPISQAYTFEVSSPGVGRDLVRPWHFDRYVGQPVELRLIRGGKDGRDFMGKLLSHDDDSVTLELEGAPRSFLKKDCAFIRLYEELDLTRDFDDEEDEDED